ncbi:nitrilase-related carbon-nitrogen hydrolase [Methanolobus sp. ZRKC5]|uniref:nitrilase-related carbon-nitrogen hydrolase n=1 Tax=unclassified Methanolobus TaxID=2629569 RepID=UPI00313ED9CE
MNTIKAACIQMDILHCEKEANISKALFMAREAKAKGADILIFPEVFSTGFCYEDVDNSAEPENGETVRKMCDFSRENQCVLIFSLIEKKKLKMVLIIII